MSSPLPKLETCLNCGKPTDDNFCSHCGQENEDQTASVKSVLGDFFDDIAHFDSKLFQTIVPLLFKPGFLTCQYNEGKRVRYVSPYRIYLFVTFIFFFMFSYSSASREIVNSDTTRTGSTQKTSAELADARKQIAVAAQQVNAEGDNGVGTAIAKAALKSAQTQVDQASLPPAKASGDGDGGNLNIIVDTGQSHTKMLHVGSLATLPKTVGDYERQQASLDSHHKDNWIKRLMIERYIVFKQNPSAYTASLVDDIPKMVFFLVPLFAVVLKLLYIRRKRFYVEHLIFSLHCHAFVFICLTILLLTRTPFSTYLHIPASVAPYVSGVVWIALTVYLYIAMKRVYSQSYGKTFAKFLIAGWSYSVLLTVAFIMTLLYAFVVS